MYRMSISAFVSNALTLVIIAVTASPPVQSVEARAHEMSEVSCSVTDEQILAATAGEHFTLDTNRCTAGVRMMVEHTFSQVHKDHAAFYEQTHLNPEAAADVSLLLARRQLLSGTWSAGPAERYTISKDSALLNQIEARLHEYLTSQQVLLLKEYEETIPARTLIEPVVSLLEKQGRALSAIQYAEAMQNVKHSFAEWLRAFRRRRKPIHDTGAMLRTSIVATSALGRSWRDR